jgi:glyoxylase-like metal-dependent hydrolase (beta-lactamase superfamily II)
MEGLDPVEQRENLYALWTRDFAPAQYCSVYVLDGEVPAVVDTGTGAHVDRILDALAALGIQRADLGAIVLTHVHLDHAGGAAALADACPNATVFVHESGASHLVDPERLWTGTKRAVGDQIQAYAKPVPLPDHRIHRVTEGDEIDLGDHTLTVHRAPGHAFHQVVYHDSADGGVFTGDAMGVLTPGLDRVQPSSPPPNFDLEGCLRDVETIRDLDPTRLYLAHYGAHSPADLLDTYPAVLESWVETVAETRDRLGEVEAVEYFVDRAETVAAWGELKAEGEARMNAQGVLDYLSGRR